MKSRNELQQILEHIHRDLLDVLAQPRLDRVCREKLRHAVEEALELSQELGRLPQPDKCIVARITGFLGRMIAFIRSITGDEH
jgi:DNA invertase Pin-like site-specific DNA recombinase